MFKIKNLSVSYKKNKIIDIKSYEFKKKGLYVLVGPNGSGKTTLAKAMMNLLNYEGVIYYDDIDIKKYGSKLYEKICYIDQFGNFIDELTEFDNYNILKEIGIDSPNENNSKRKMNKFSGGQRKCIEEKRINIKSYESYILDEPSVSLDKDNKQLLISKIKELSKEHLVIVITHDEDIINISDNILNIDSIEKECIISEKLNYFSEKNIKNRKLLFKLSFSNFRLRIINYIFTCIFAFALLFLFNLLEYSPNTIGKKIIEYSNFCPLEADVDEREELYTQYQDYINGNYVSEYALINVDMNHDILADKDSKNFLINNNPNLYYSLKNHDFDGVEITDYLTYLLFGDTKDHSGEVFFLNYKSSLKNKSIPLTITKTIYTFFDVDKYNAGISKDYKTSISVKNLCNMYLGYVVVSEKLVNSLKEEIDFEYHRFVVGKNEKIPNGYNYKKFTELYDLNEMLQATKVYTIIILCSVVVLMVYTSYALNYLDKNKLSNYKKLKSLGVNVKDIKIINNISCAVTAMIAFLFSLLSFVIINSINYNYVNSMLEDYKFKYIYNKYYYISILFVIMIIYLWMKNCYFKKKFEENK